MAKKQGRPPKNGARSGWMLLRSMWAIFGYHAARAAGEKHEAALTEAVKFVKMLCPDMPISETEVKRALAEYQPEASTHGYTIEELSDSELHAKRELYRSLGVPANFSGGWTFGIRPKPTCARVNAKAANVRMQNPLSIAAQ